MGSLFFTCPRSRRVIEPGIDMDSATFRKVASLELSVRCPHCDDHHDCRVDSGHLFEPKPRRRQVHSIALLCDEIDVGAFLARARSAGRA